MKLYSLLGNQQQLDGGAMFGNAPRTIWSRWLTPDIDNRVTLACRCLLVQIPGMNILLETGIGAFFEPKLKERYGVLENDHKLLASLADIGLTHEDIDYIVLSHLHFDHAGGLLSAWQPGQSPKLLFPNARFLLSQAAWDRASNPHARDKTSFIPQLNELLTLSSRIEIYEEGTQPLGPLFTFHLSHGHTPGMLLTEVKTPKGPILFAADLIPGLPWVHLPITMGYDRFPEKIIDEKQDLLSYLADNKGKIFFTHDPLVALAQVVHCENKFLTTESLTHIKDEF